MTTQLTVADATISSSIEEIKKKIREAYATGKRPSDLSIASDLERLLEAAIQGGGMLGVSILNALKQASGLERPESVEVLLSALDALERDVSSPADTDKTMASIDQLEAAGFEIYSRVVDDIMEALVEEESEPVEVLAWCSLSFGARVGSKKGRDLRHLFNVHGGVGGDERPALCGVLGSGATCESSREQPACPRCSRAAKKRGLDPESIGLAQDVLAD